MAWRWGPGPVFAIELRAAARRWQTYAVRVLFVLALLTAFGITWKMQVDEKGALTINDMARSGESFYYGLVGTQLALLLLSAPAATAGAVCVDKARGCLLHLLMTDLSNAEIVLGKLAARLMPVFSLLLAGLPVLGAATLAGGIEPWTVFGALFVSAGVAVFGCALALLLSVWAGKTHEVLVAAYVVEALALLAVPVWMMVARIIGLPVFSAPGWLRKMNPCWLAFAPYASPGSSDWYDPLLFFAGAVAISAGLVLMAMATVRRAAVRYGNVVIRPARVRRWQWRWRLPGPSLDRNPVLWREWQRRQPSRWLRAIWFLFRVAAVSTTVAAIGFHLFGGGLFDLVPMVNALVVTMGLLLFSVSAVTSLTEERVRGSLDVLLTTPLTTRSIVWGKWWGTFRTIPVLAALPALSLAICAAFPSRLGVVRPAPSGNTPLPDRSLAVVVAAVAVVLILVYGAALTSLGLALATWVRRVGRASALCTAAYVAMTVGPIVTALVISPREENLWILFACPFFAVGASSDVVGREFLLGLRERFIEPALLWVAIYAIIALGLLALTLFTFDRQLGRVRQQRRPSERGVIEYEAAVQ
jgi:ABC-type Na+ efflux pump permease subunit